MESIEKIMDFISSGYGDGSGFGSGYGYGDGSGSGSGDGSGDGSGSGSGVKTVNKEAVYIIDGIQTFIDRVRGNIAKGRVLMGDLTTKKCYIVKQNGMFAHGETLREAQEALTEKLFEDMPEGERIEEFVKTHEKDTVYSDKDYFDWHHRLTGSCEMGRMAFAKDHGLESLDGERTVLEFIELCENSYGGETIKKLRVHYE